ncbi:MULTISPECIES: hypothetical protein [unclassified Mesorhizobium]|uniref:hypothetical protein n=1 Tax=unclassified Mesorhizobium TaxID=325217 RepID=UPI000FCB2AD1|nr:MULTISPECIES: hypothetical protein [unclassified Mesorhizobium]RUV19987.1 hypothetical protein EOB80_17390 [Mesorhizobium sp. M7A.F.Ca.MR.245.00.0.0]RUV36279.1 hypothetical protein EOB49_17295 [Mesorhizobium sp. M7A.F.Ca.MR.148.00.0.0]RUV53761.1 hypothetical protein EOB77_00460 [Mesorhizobium sp. M7A.F.Ca.MR.228.00.0.0]
MDDEDRLLKRLQESAEDLGRQLSGKSNFPIEDFLDVVELEGLRDTFGIDPKAFTADDMTRILMVQGPLYALVEQVNELDAEGKHSIEQILHVLNRMYVNAQAHLNAKSAIQQVAMQALEAQEHTRPIPINPEGPIGQTIVNASTEVINNVHVTNNQINISLLNGWDVDVLKNLRVQIRRLSASAFAVNVKVNTKVMFEGTIQFLSTTADRVLSDLRDMAASLKESFGSAEAIVKSLDKVIQSGTKFVRLVGSLIQDALGDAGDHKEIKLSLRNANNAKTITAGYTLADGKGVLCGRSGVIYTITPNGQVTTGTADGVGIVNGVAELQDGRLVLATSDGMSAWTPRFQGGGTEHSRLRTKLVAVAAQHFQGAETVVAANSYGDLDRWWFPGGRPDIFGDQGPTLPGQKNRHGRVISLLVMGERTVVAREHAIMVVDGDLEREREVPFNQSINAICRLNETEVVIVGDGLVAVVDTHGLPVRLLPTPVHASYISVVVLAEHLIAVCDAKGRVVAVDLKSGAELGEIDVQMESRGLITVGKFLVAYGGAWNAQSRAMAFILWEERIAAQVG